MADDDVKVKFSAETSGLVTAKTGFRDIVAEMEQFEAQSNSMTNATKGVSEGMKGLQLSTVGAKREVIVLGHELLTGNLSRVPGSLLVLAERMGGLSTSFLLGAGAAAGLGIALYEIAASAENAAEALNQIGISLEAQGRAGIAKEQLSTYITTLSKLPGVSHDAAQAIVVDLSTAANISQTSFEKLTTIVADYAAVTRESAPKAAEDLVKMSQDPVKAATQLAETYKGILTPAQYEAIQNFQALGDKMSAMDVLADALQKRFTGLQQQGLTPLQEGLNVVGNFFARVGHEILNMLDFISPLIRAVGDLKIAFDALTGNKGTTATPLDHVQDQLNAEVVKGLELENQVGGKLREQLKLQQEIQQFKNARGAALASGDTQDAAKFLADQQEAQEKLNKLNKPDTSASAQYLSDQRQMYAEAYQIKSSYAQLAFESGKITKQEEVSQQKAALAEEFEAESLSLNKTIALYAQGTKEHQKAVDQKKLSEQKYALEVVKLDAQVERQKEQIQKQSESKLKSSLSTIQAAFNAQAISVITGQEKIGQGFLKLAGTLVTSMINAFLQIGEQWIATQLLELVTGEATTNAIIAGHAGEAYAAAYAATSAIPIIGPALAPGVAAASGLAAEAGGLALASFDVGTNYVPSDGVAMIHQGERIIPKADNAKLNDALDKGAGGGDTHAHFHFHTLDQQGVASMLKRNAGGISKAVAGAARGGSGNLRSAFSKL